ncbi:MAG: hypothetical protein M3406_08740 [Chloroflexota bacterium]|nr:hypothetical protein [Chloroflexota bacterium]
MSRSGRAEVADLPGFKIGRGGPAFLEVRVVRRSQSDAADVDDADWVRARILASSGGFRANYDADLLSSEFPRWRQDLVVLIRDSAAEARLETLEKWIAVTLAHADRAGHITASCEITDHPGMGAVLRFDIELNTPDLAVISRELDSLIAAYPAPDRR